MTDTEILKAPFPYPGGKGRVADLVWDRLGNVDNFIEPFAGSLAVTLRRPADHFAGKYRAETVNDKNHYIVNFWRALKADPDAVAEWADWSVNEADLHARHRWLVRSQEAADWRERMRTDPDAYDAKIAGWWCWGQCLWIGGAWCHDETLHKKQLPSGNSDGKGYGVTRGGSVDWQQVPEIGSAVGRGVASSHGGGRPQLADAYDIGRGVCGSGSRGTCEERRAWLVGWMRRLSDRLRLVRTCYGDWSRVCDSESTTTRLGTTGVFLDPPYPARREDTGEKSRDDSLYATDKGSDLDKLRDEVRNWCWKWGLNPDMRIAVCGYEGDGYEQLEQEGWSVESWEAGGGYANQQRKGLGKSANAKRERIWFSPACIQPDTTPGLFDGLGD